MRDIAAKYFVLEMNLINACVRRVEGFLERRCVGRDGNDSSTRRDDVVSRYGGSGMENNRV